MKKIFLKRILPVALCMLMVFPTLIMGIGAINESLTGTPGDMSIVGSERANWAPNGQGYHTSAWNYDRHSKYLNNGTYAHSYQYWQPSDPARPNGAGVDPTKQHVGFSFDDGYYLLDEVVIYANSYDRGYNNIKYRVEALILGEWVEVGVGYQDDGTPSDKGGDVTRLSIDLSYYRCGVCDSPCGATWEKCQYVQEEIKDDEGNVVEVVYGGCGASKSNFVEQVFYQCSDAKCNAFADSASTKCSACGKDTVVKKYDINTNNVRVWSSEYGSYAKRYGDYINKQPTWHDWWLTPCMQEVELWGVTGYRPAFDVPLNAYLVTNAALSGMLGADDGSVDMRYPGMAGDNDLTTSWKARRTGASNLWAEFDKAYMIDNVGFNIGGCSGADAGLTLTYNVYILKSGTATNGVWEVVATDQTAVTQADSKYVMVNFDEPTEALGMKIEFTSVKDSAGKNGRAVASELMAKISDGGKCIFLADYITTAKKISTATGNLACYGAAYASSSFSYAGISKVSSIIDGNVSYSDNAWIAQTYVLGTYVGVTLKEAHDVSKVVLYFGDILGGTNGENVFEFDLQAKIDGKFETIASATSYDAAKKSYTVSIELPEAVYTDDIRIVFTSDAQTFPYLKEIEVFEEGFYYSSFVGYALDSSRVMGGPAATAQFGDRTVARRGKYFDKQSPLSYYNIALEHGVEIDWLG